MEVPQEVLEVRGMFTNMEDDAAAALGPCPEGIAESWLDIHLPAADIPDGDQARDSHTVIVHPTPPNPAAPLVVMFYGGGFQCGRIKQVLLPARAAALRYGAVVACPTYPLAPENKFPVPVQTAYRTVAWLSDLDSLNGVVPGLKMAGVVVDLSAGFVLIGFSAGANIAAALPASWLRLPTPRRPSSRACLLYNRPSPASISASPF